MAYSHIAYPWVFFFQQKVYVRFELTTFFSYHGAPTLAQTCSPADSRDHHVLLLSAIYQVYNTTNNM